jgi:predicted cupin superfamily sugar epimerase
MKADEVRRLLQLQPLEPEGGSFRETHRSRWQVPREQLPEGVQGARSTAIYYMITPETFSSLHRLPGAEIFHFYLGDPAVMLQLHPDGGVQTITLGHDLGAGHQPQAVVCGGSLAGMQAGPWRRVGFDGNNHVSRLRLRRL